MSIGEHNFDKAASEFEDDYEARSSSVDLNSLTTEVFSAELLEEPCEILDPAKPICVSPDTMVADAIQGMADRNHGCVIVEENGVLVGIFTERDVVRRVFGRGIDPHKTAVRAVMTRDPEAVSFADSIATVLNKMTVGGFRHVPLVDLQRRPVGIVSIKDVVEYFVERFPKHVLNVAPDPTVRHPDEIAGAG